MVNPHVRPPLYETGQRAANALAKAERVFYAPEGHLVDWKWRRVVKPAMPPTGYCGKAGKP